MFGNLFHTREAQRDPARPLLRPGVTKLRLLASSCLHPAKVNQGFSTLSFPARDAVLELPGGTSGPQRIAKQNLPEQRTECHNSR